MPLSKTPRRRNAVLMHAWQRRGVLACVLWPFSLLMGLLVRLRRAGYRRGWLSTVRLSVPVIVVGNITVGGAGKTPLTIHLVEALRQRGRNPGVISRGYGRISRDIRAVCADSVPADVGDEPLLIWQRTGAPVWVGRDRAAAGQALLVAYPDVDVLICDDGLQHYRLQRDAEIAVFDGRGVMNGWLLPAGPLREPVSRLSVVDALVFNACAVPQRLTFDTPHFAMHMEVGGIYRLGLSQQMPTATHHSVSLTHFTGPVHALAGIGNPQRFFDQLTSRGLTVMAHAFPDHHDYCSTDIPLDGHPVLTTEKDAVKLTQLLGALPATLEIWVVPVTAQLDPELVSYLLEIIDGPTSA